ncbi:MAG: hypothetical protein COT92_02695 [Candidatus Doudnabacteria bacterium CG10_big_fil_rev_8_21_14_0_10_42_18]|uniref:Uncharacterized protein n=1 Tax=Candidatus Doudnabacteria bacterium CG10_big_fil_rev_8_21_14_0_10_42_18 TaxID=1974552 RepID=A0A2H0VAQ2_9BACT|nr:MAG: hypothetical protein COT92_02695 [Candidatus Doudnabacteria bacterium CG10_big_fil_rev_8_21_14_0_10_42_18]
MIIKDGGKQRERRHIEVKFGDKEKKELERLLPEQRGTDAKIRFFLEVMVEVALSDEKVRIVPESLLACKGKSVWISAETYRLVCLYGKLANMSAGAQATNLLVAGLELLKKSGISQPLGKEELARKITQELGKRNRLGEIRQGFRLIWRGLSGR